jgi:acyl-CoA carboxylase epsilon subunit
LLARAAVAAGAEPPPRTALGWADRASLLRRPVFPVPGAWRASALRR